MAVIGSYWSSTTVAQYQFTEHYNRVRAGALRMETVGAVPLVDPFAGLSAPVWSSPLPPPAQMSSFGDVSNPNFAYGCGAGGYLTNEKLLEEQGVQPVVVEKQVINKKNVQTTTEVKQVPTRISPQQVEQKILADPAYRAQMEQKLGGRILLDGLADGNVVVHRRGPSGPCAPTPMGAQAACCHHLHRMEYGFPAGLQNLGISCSAPGMTERDMYRAFQARTMGYVQGYRAGYRDGSRWLGGTINCPGFLGRRCGPMPTDFADMVAGSLDDTMTRIHRAQELMYRTQQVFADSQAALQNARMSVDWMRARRLPS